LSRIERGDTRRPTWGIRMKGRLNMRNSARLPIRFPVGSKYVLKSHGPSFGGTSSSSNAKKRCHASAGNGNRSELFRTSVLLRLARRSLAYPIISSRGQANADGLGAPQASGILLHGSECPFARIDVSRNLFRLSMCRRHVADHSAIGRARTEQQDYPEMTGILW